MRYKANLMGGEAAVRAPRKPGGGTRSADLQKERRQVLAREATGSGGAGMRRRLTSCIKRYIYV
jgi:hypothetical protein